MKVLVLLLLLSLLSIVAHSASIQLQWDANSESDLLGYKIYRSNTNIKPFKNVSTLHKQTTVIFNNISSGKPYYWAVTAFSSFAESDYSNIVYMYQPLPPLGLTAIFNGIIIRP